MKRTKLAVKGMVFMLGMLLVFESIGLAQAAEVVIRGPRPLAGLVADAVREERPNLAVRVEESTELRNRVWMSGPGGENYLPISPKRKQDMLDARASGRSVYLALCGEQKFALDRLLGPQPVIQEVAPQPQVIYKDRVPQQPVQYVEQYSPQYCWVPPVYAGVYPFFPYWGYGYSYDNNGWYPRYYRNYHHHGSRYYRGYHGHHHHGNRYYRGYHGYHHGGRGGGHPHGGGRSHGGGHHR